jgi:hypothetical protein
MQQAPCHLVHGTIPSYCHHYGTALLSRLLCQFRRMACIVGVNDVVVKFAVVQMQLHACCYIYLTPGSGSWIDNKPDVGALSHAEWLSAKVILSGLEQKKPGLAGQTFLYSCYT